MFESGVLPHDPAGGAAGGVSAPAEEPVAPLPAEDAADLLASLGAGGALAGVVEGLLARLLVPVRSDGEDAGSAVDAEGLAGKAGTAESEGLFSGEPGGDAALVAVAEGRRVASVEEAASSGLMALGAAGLGELAAACHRLAAWASWGEALAAACLTGCGELSMHPDQWGPDGAVSPVVGFEERRFNTACLLSARLGLSRTQAGRIVDHGSALMDVGFGPAEAMERCGVLDAAKASLVTRRLEGVPVPVALSVQERVLPQAPRRSVSQVGRDIERALMEVDPDGHAERARHNVQRRCVSRPRPAGEGVSQIRLLLPTMDALLLDATLDAVAASARAAGERRTLAQLRADAVTAMTLQTLRASQQAAYQPPTRGCGDGDEQAGSWRLLPDGVPLEGLLGALSGLVGSVGPWWTPSGTGHLPLPENIHVTVQVTVPLYSLAGLTGLAGQAPPGDPPGRSPGAVPGGGDPGDGERIQNPATNPGDAAHTDGPDSASRSAPTTSGRSLPACRCSASVSRSAEAGLDATEAAQVAEVTVGARSAAVPALTAWALAAGGTWRRLVTDPVGGVVIDVGRTRYRPPTGLADLVRARDGGCVFPTCQAPASGCDIDHLTAWSEGGTTSLDNLVVLCQAHHRLKHTPGWALTRDEATKVLSWHAPDKTVYQRRLDGTIIQQPRKAGPRQHHIPGAVVPTELSKQIGPEIIDRLNRAVDRALDDQAHDHTGLDTNANGSGRAQLETRGPHPGQRAGDYEPAPYPQAAHTLGLAPLIDEAPPF